MKEESLIVEKDATVLERRRGGLPVRRGGMYEGFSGQARKAMQFAHQEARRRRHDYVGTEHLLLGTLREGSAAVTNLLAAVGVEVETVYRALEAHMPPATGGASWD